MPLPKVKVKEGHEIRGLVIKVYPTKEDLALLRSLQKDLRVAWNWLCGQKTEVLEARDAYATREGLVPPKPEKPNYDGLEPEVAKAVKEAYIVACRERAFKVNELTQDLAGFEFRTIKDWMCHFGCKQDYQLLTKVIGWRYSKEDTRDVKTRSSMLQALVRNYLKKAPGQRRKKRKKEDEEMPLSTRSEMCFKLVDDGGFYNCKVKINGIRIRGRLPGRRPPGRVLEGVTITEKADGWYASIKVEVPIRKLPEPTKGTEVGIDVGLDYIAAIQGSITAQVENPRGKVLAGKIAALQAAKRPVGRLHLKAARQVEHLIYNQIVKPLAQIETVKVERLNARIGQMGGSVKVSFMRKAVCLLKGRYGARVVEVAAPYTSQKCSNCGHLDKEAWSYKNRIGVCTKCGHTQDRDLNAASNIAKSVPLPFKEAS